jgi:hypothetical protein
MLMYADSYLQRNSTAIGVIATLAVGIIGWLIVWLLWRRDQKSKTLDYRVISDIQILATRDHRPDTLKITLGPLEVQNPFISRIRFKNTGKQVIEASDFLEPLVILRPSANLIDFRVEDSSEKHLTEKIEHILRTPEK